MQAAIPPQTKPSAVDSRPLTGEGVETIDSLRSCRGRRNTRLIVSKTNSDAWPARGSIWPNRSGFPAKPLRLGLHILQGRPDEDCTATRSDFRCVSRDCVLARSPSADWSADSFASSTRSSCRKQCFLWLIASSLPLCCVVIMSYGDSGTLLSL